MVYGTDSHPGVREHLEGVNKKLNFSLSVSIRGTQIPKSLRIVGLSGKSRILAN
jgi:hypothetical protein